MLKNSKINEYYQKKFKKINPSPDSTTMNSCPDSSDLYANNRQVIYIDEDVFVGKYYLSIAGVRYKISNAMCRVLCAINEYKGEVVSRKFLLAIGWGVGNKGNNNVTVAISELRALLKHGSNLEIITVHGKGYKMINENKDFLGDNNNYVNIHRRLTD
jgi:DNA-binding winged helix-turn-helix (wHTH) protein